MESGVEHRRFECSALPKGWFREEVSRSTGLSAGKINVCYYSPNGKKFLTKPQLARYLGDSVDLSSFDFQTGKVNNLFLRKVRQPPKPQFNHSVGTRSDSSLVAPIRQTASIFKQPVTIHKTQESRVKVDFKHGPQEKPKQLFWEKRLDGLRVSHPDGTEHEAIDLPKGIKAMGPGLSAETVVYSIATALHVGQAPVMGQTGDKSNLESNLSAFLNSEQPLIQAVKPHVEDITYQEAKVAAARKQLQDELNALL